MEDRTDHNRLAEQFAARLMDYTETIAPEGTVRTPNSAKAAEVVHAEAPRVEPAPPAAAALRIITCTPEIVVCDQNSPEWHRARMGIPTASSFDLILTPSKKKENEAMPDGSFSIKTEDDLRAAIEGYANTKKKVTAKRHIVARARAIDALDLLPEGWDDGNEKKTSDAVQQTRRTYMLKLVGEILTGEPMDMVMTRDMERGHALEPEARDLYTLQTGAALERVGFVKRGRVGCSPDSLIGDDGGLEIKTKAPHLLIDCILKDEFPEEHKAQVQGALWITGRKWWDIAVYWPGLPLFVKRAYRDEEYIANLASEIERFNTDLDAIVEQMRARMGEDFTEFAAAA